MAHQPRIQLLGNPVLTIGSEALYLPPRLIALLSTFTLRKVSVLDRAEISGILWPHATPASGRHSLSQSLYMLRKETRGRLRIRGTSRTIEFGDLAADVYEFEDAIEKGDWESAAGLFRGELLDGFEIPQATDFNEWISSLRSRYHELALTVAEELELQGAASAAANLRSRLLGGGSSSILVDRAVPDRPSIAKGRTSHEPSTDAAARFGVRSAFFVGRKQELSVLEHFHEQSVLSGMTCVLLEGEAGIGKTTLVHRFARRRALRGSRVVVAQSYAAEAHVPFGVVAQWLDDLPNVESGIGPPWDQILANAFPDYWPGPSSSPMLDDGSSHQYQILEALTRLFTEASLQQPLLMVLDDADFADPASTAFVHYLARRSPQAPILFLGTARTSSPSTSGLFASWRNLQRIVLQPMSLREAELLIAKLTGSHTASSDLARETVKRTGGNPLLISNLLAAAAPDRSAKLPDSVVEFFEPRFAALSIDALVTLAAIGMVGEPAGIELVAEVAGLPAGGDSARAVLNDLTDEGLIIHEPEGTLRPRHGLVTEAALAKLPEAERRALYGRAPRIMQGVGRSSAAVTAVQHDIAGDRKEAFEAAMIAAAASKDLFASREQEFFLKLALSNATDADAAAEVRIALGELLRIKGRFGEGLDMVAEEMMEAASPILKRRAAAARLDIRLAGSTDPKSTAAAFYQIEELASYLDDETVAELYWHLAQAAHDLGSVADTLGAAQRAENHLQRVDSPSVRSIRLAANCALVVGLYSSAREGLARLDGIISAMPLHPGSISHCLASQGSLLVMEGNLLEGEARLLEGLELAERYWLHTILHTLHNNLGVCYIERGRYSDAERELSKAGECVGTEDSTVAIDNLAILQVERAEWELAARTTRAITSSAETRSSRRLFLHHAINGLASLELGRLAQAFESKREIELLFQSHEYWSNDMSYVETFLARMLAMEGKENEARTRLETALEVYHGRYMMCRSRLELELARLDLRSDPGASLRRCERMLERLRGSGARPLIERFEELADRARLRLS
jgi:tetratricopeptide (TPR) repeat protein